MREYSHLEKTTNKKGYVMLYMPEHPRAVKNRVFEHIIVWEKANQKNVPKGHVIHHINGIKSDNRIENLQLLTVSEHTILHHSNKKRSIQTRKKLSEKAKERFKTPQSHPLYKDLPFDKILEAGNNGETIKSVCKKYNICRFTYYKKLKERGALNG
jgi:hypothetical protein